MDRRKALRSIGLSLGYIAATPTVLSLLHSCKKDINKTIAWQPKFLTSNQGSVLKTIVDLILPKTNNLPGAVDLNIHTFIDLYIAEVYSKENQEKTKQGLKAIFSALKISESNPVANLKEEAYHRLLSHYLKTTKEQVETFENNPTDKMILDTLKGLRSMTVWAYKTTEKIGENVLAYDPIPGTQKGCVSLEETTGGMAWSL